MIRIWRWCAHSYFPHWSRLQKSGEETPKTIWHFNSALSRKGDKIVSFSWKLMVTRKIFASKQVIGLNPMDIFSWTVFNSQWASSPWVTTDHKRWKVEVKGCWELSLRGITGLSLLYRGFVRKAATLVQIFSIGKANNHTHHAVLQSIWVSSGD